MRIHLKERDYYEDLYDSFTVDTCRHMRFSDKEIPDEEFLGQDLSEEQIKALKDIKGGWIDVVREIGTFCYAAERYKDKSEAIDEWMKKTVKRTKDWLNLNHHVMFGAESACLPTYGSSLKTNTGATTEASKSDFCACISVLYVRHDQRSLITAKSSR